MKASMSKAVTLPIFIITVVLLILICLGVYILQNHRATNLNHQLTNSKTQIDSLNSSNSVLKTQSTNLSKQLNTANQDIAKLTQNDTFVPGSACQTEQLALSWEQYLSGPLGGDGGVFSYQNISSTPCTVDGYPGFLALDKTGHVTPDGPISTGFNSGADKIAPESITLNSNDKAYFVVEWGSMMGGGPNGAVCVIPSLIESTPPGDTIPVIAVLGSGPNICSGAGPISALTTESMLTKLSL
jgi:hypothetical protein